MPRWVPGLLLGVATSVLASIVYAALSHAWTEVAQLQRDINALTAARLEPTPLPEPPDPTPPPPPQRIRGNPDPDDRGSVERVWRAELAERVGRLELANLYAQADTESGFRPKAVSPVGAEGVAQFMPRTWAEESPRTEPSCAGVPPTDVPCSARAQQAYMTRIEKWVPRGARSIENTWAAYNWGAGNVKKAVRRCEAAMGCDPENWRDMERFVPTETKRYVKRNRRISIGLRRGSVEASFSF